MENQAWEHKDQLEQTIDILISEIESYVQTDTANIIIKSLTLANK